LLDSYRGIEQAEVVTAVPLDQGDTQRLSQRLSAVLGKNISIKAEVDASIIGGIVARVGGKLLDGSTRGKLLALKQKIAGGGK
jgi:F-type H+-transporting ATPase subunit delta